MNGTPLKKFDDDDRGDHALLRADDDCRYFLEYTKGKRFDFSEANGFISNLKKSPKKRGTYEWKHKLRAIADAAKTLEIEIPKAWLEDSTFVPVPPSKAEDHAEYDDRMAQILRKIKGIDVRELVHQKESMAATHVSDERHTVTELAANYEIDEDEVEPTPGHIVIVDDMITAGAHFRAMSRVIGRRFPDVPISGLFLARRVFPAKNEQD
jgi:hypothetical protein